MADPSHRPEGCLNTGEMIAKIEATFDLRLARETLRSWANRDDDPLPIAYRANKAGQSHWFRWVDFLEWFEREQDRQEAIAAAFADRPVGDGHATAIDHLDWHSAKTVSAREAAKRDILLTAKLEGRYADVSTMERLAEDSARLAAQALLALPSKLAPRLAGLSDELEIDRLLDTELRAVCQALEQATRRALSAADLAPDLDPAAPTPGRLPPADTP
jgi:hypothetical protein